MAADFEILEVSWRGEQYRVRVRALSDASPEAVYDRLAHLDAHREWANRRFGGLTSLEPAGSLLEEGLHFVSRGPFPGGGTWRNLNTVTAARRPVLIEWRSEGEIAGGRGAPKGIWVNRFEIEPEGRGSRLTYEFRRTAFAGRPWYLRWPGPGDFFHRVTQPRWAGVTCAAIARQAERA